MNVSMAISGGGSKASIKRKKEEDVVETAICSSSKEKMELVTENVSETLSDVVV